MWIGKCGSPQRRDDHLAGGPKRRELSHGRGRQAANICERAFQKDRQLSDGARVVSAPKLQRTFALLVLEYLLWITGHQARTEERRPIASRTFSRELKAEMRMNPSPAWPKPAPGVVTTFASFRSLSKNSQESPLTFTQR